LVQAHIPEYEFGNRANHDPTRQRKLLLHRDQIARLTEFTREQGRTLVPIRLYWKGGRAKVLLGLARGKAQHDKRAAIAERDADRQMQRALREHERVSS
jgi:SsrA-binding protein